MAGAGGAGAQAQDRLRGAVAGPGARRPWSLTGRQAAPSASPAERQPGEKQSRAAPRRSAGYRTAATRVAVGANGTGVHAVAVRITAVAVHAIRGGLAPADALTIVGTAVGATVGGRTIGRNDDVALAHRHGHAGILQGVADVVFAAVLVGAAKAHTGACITCVGLTILGAGIGTASKTIAIGCSVGHVIADARGRLTLDGIRREESTAPVSIALAIRTARARVVGIGALVLRIQTRGDRRTRAICASSLPFRAGLALPITSVVAADPVHAVTAQAVIRIVTGVAIGMTP